MSSNTKIKFKRSSNNVSTLDSLEERLLFGEPLLIDSGDKYLVLGPGPVASDNDNEQLPSRETLVSKSIFFRGMSQEEADQGVMYIENNGQKILVSQKTKDQVAAKEICCTAVFNKNTIQSNDNKYYLLCNDSNKQLYNFDLGDIGIYIDSKGVLHGGAWNDYAENREYDDEVTIEDLSGRVVCENGHGKLILSRERLQPCAYVVSDTFGVTIGEGNVSVAVAGRVLVHIDDEVELGDCVAAGFNGKATKMTRQEIINYPDRILGTVIEIPDYDKFNDKSVNGRVWIRVK